MLALNDRDHLLLSAMLYYEAERMDHIKQKSSNPVQRPQQVLPARQIKLTNIHSFVVL